MVLLRMAAILQLPLLLAQSSVSASVDDFWQFDAAPADLPVLSLLQHSAVAHHHRGDIDSSGNGHSHSPPPHHHHTTTSTKYPKRGDIEPIYYLHIPKAGSSFSTTIAHYTCGSALPRNLSMCFAGDAVKDPRYSDQCRPEMFYRFADAGHAPLRKGAPLGQVVVMMRAPLQRILSGYYAYPGALHSCNELERKYNCHHGWCDGDKEGADGLPRRSVNHIPPVDYGRCVENCTTNMLTNRGCGTKGKADVAGAKEIVRKLGFLGISDHWALSVCLFHARFGGECLEAEFANNHKGSVSSASTGVSSFAKRNGDAPSYDSTSHFGHWRPHADDEVYDYALARFRQEMEDNGVSPSTCAERCPGVPKERFESFPFEGV